MGLFQLLFLCIICCYDINVRKYHVYNDFNFFYFHFTAIRKVINCSLLVI